MDDAIFDFVLRKVMYYYVLYREETEKKCYISKLKCPRCGVVHMPGDITLAATSAISSDDIPFYICNECSLDDRTQATGPLDLLEWAIVEGSFNI